MHMNMVFANDPFQYLHIFRITDLNDQFSTSLLNITLQNWVSVFCHPDQANHQKADRVPTSPLLSHEPYGSITV